MGYMTILKDLFGQQEYKVIQGSMDTVVNAVTYDSRHCSEGSLFVCISGFTVDGHDYIFDAIEKGATAIMAQRSVWETKAIDLGNCKEKALTVIVVEDSRASLAAVSTAFYKNPSARLLLVGITGTKGKTTSSYMVRDILQAAGRHTGLIGTIKTIIDGKEEDSSSTTPESSDLQKIFREMVEKGDDSCVMEVSSQGLMLDRVGGCSFDIGAFTNFYRDHIGENEHSSMEEYLAWKCSLFEKTQIAVINGDCEVAPEVSGYAKEKGNEVYRYGMSPDFEVYAKDVKPENKNGVSGMSFLLFSPWYKGEVFVGLATEFNVHNALCAITIAGLSQVSFPHVLCALEQIKVPGRLQNIPHKGDFSVVVDYAHNPSSLEQLLLSLRDYTKGRLITVFGCGGNRSHDRRFLMGEVSGRLSDVTVITSDNPRKEEPAAIMEDIITGIRPTGGVFEVEEDRTCAIRLAINMAQEGDIVIIAGKGHENYQIFKDRTIHYDDAEIAGEILEGMTRT